MKTVQTTTDAEGARSTACGGCAEAAELRGLVEFYKLEASAWREAFEQQRGGKAFDDQQKELTDARAELQRLRNNGAGSAASGPTS